MYLLLNMWHDKIDIMNTSIIAMRVTNEAPRHRRNMVSPFGAF